MLWIAIKSRWANLTVSATGVFYAVAAVALLVWLTVDTWGTASRLDHLLQVMLLGIVAVAVWMVANSFRNLRLRQHA